MILLSFPILFLRARQMTSLRKPNTRSSSWIEEAQAVKVLPHYLGQMLTKHTHTDVHVALKDNVYIAFSGEVLEHASPIFASMLRFGTYRAREVSSDSSRFVVCKLGPRSVSRTYELYRLAMTWFIRFYLVPYVPTLYPALSYSSSTFETRILRQYTTYCSFFVMACHPAWYQKLPRKCFTSPTNTLYLRLFPMLHRYWRCRLLQLPACRSIATRNFVLELDVVQFYDMRAWHCMIQK